MAVDGFVFAAPRFFALPPFQKKKNRKINIHCPHSQSDSMERSISPEFNPDAPFNVSKTLTPPRVNKAAGTTNVTFDGLLSDPLLLKEDLKNGCGGQLWPAGMTLARYLLAQHASDMSGKTMSVSPCVCLGKPVAITNLSLPPLLPRVSPVCYQINRNQTNTSV